VIKNTKLAMHARAHPGEILLEMYLKPLGVTITVVASALGVPRKHVSAIIHGRAPVTPDLALRLASAFATEPELWVNMQAQYDLWTVIGKDWWLCTTQPIFTMFSAVFSPQSPPTKLFGSLNPSSTGG
jgi:addiction module HigA family antidote